MGGPTARPPTNCEPGRELRTASCEPRVFDMQLKLPVAVLCLTLVSTILGARASQFPNPAFDPKMTGEQTAVLAGGCFWGVEAVFEALAGVKQCRLRLCRRQQVFGELPRRQLRDDRPCRVGADHLRRGEDLLRPAAEGVLRGCPRPDTA